MVEAATNGVDRRQQRKGRIQLILILVVFALPPVGAFLAYYNQWIPEGRTNKCELVQPVQSVSGMNFITLDGGTLATDNLKGQWIFLSVASGECGEACQQAAYNMRQVRTALAEGKEYVERVLVVPGAMPQPGLQAFLKTYPGMHVVVGNDPALARLSALLPRPMGQGVGEIYVIDPMGNLMMRYSPEQNPRDLLLDVQHLLKATQFH